MDLLLGLLLLSLATFWAWETLLGLLPDRVPAQTYPFFVLGLALGLSLLPENLLSVVAAAGTVGVLRIIVRASTGADNVTTTRLTRRRVPNIP